MTSTYATDLELIRETLKRKKLALYGVAIRAKVSEHRFYKALKGRVVLRPEELSRIAAEVGLEASK